MPYTKWYMVVDLNKINPLEKMIPVEHSLLPLEKYVFPYITGLFYLARRSRRGRVSVDHSLDMVGLELP